MTWTLCSGDQSFLAWTSFYHLITICKLENKLKIITTRQNVIQRRNFANYITNQHYMIYVISSNIVLLQILVRGWRRRWLVGVITRGGWGCWATIECYYCGERGAGCASWYAVLFCCIFKTAAIKVWTCWTRSLN